MIREDKPAPRDRRPSRLTDGGSAAWKLAWAILGFVAYLAAKYVFGF